MQSTQSIWKGTTLITRLGIIPAATHPNPTTANPKVDGWFLSDFAFNILEGPGASQTRLTAANPENPVQMYGAFPDSTTTHFRLKGFA
jgi:hypothetical protein